MPEQTHIIEPRPAATLVVVRDGGDRPEVLLLQRTHSAVFMPGVFVFPGGAVDTADADPRLAERAEGLEEAEANRLMDLEDGARGYVIAAIRECFEEAGLLLADAPGVDLHPWRQRLVDGACSFMEMCETLNITLHAGRLLYLSRWITPHGAPRRFDTRFFLTPAPAGQTAGHDGIETIDHIWITPREALERNRRGDFPLGNPTVRTLATLAEFENVGALLAGIQRRSDPVRSSKPAREAGPEPIYASGRDGRRPVHPEEPAYAEIAKLRNEGLGEGGYEIIPGVPRRLSRRVTRITAQNPGMMTGPGTNTYLIECDGATAVIDPGPELDAHTDAILATATGPIRWILATHTHPDHSPGTRALKGRISATVLGMPAPRGDSQDQRFAPDSIPGDRERLQLGDVTLRAIHTPGHASNHLCYLLEDERLLFSGDHIMQGSTVVISPPDGSMADYLAALDALHGEPVDHIAPGHGFLMGDPDAVIDRIVEHRLARERKVLHAVRRLGRASEDELLAAVYDDVPDALHRVARRSLQAHLIKLYDDGVLSRKGNRYAMQG